MSPLQQAALALKDRVPMLEAFVSNKYRATMSTVVSLKGSEYQSENVLFSECLSGAQGLNMQELMEAFADMNHTLETPLSLDFEIALVSFQLRFARQWIAQNKHDVSINVSPWIICQDDFIALLEQFADKNSTQNIILEITEYDKVPLRLMDRLKTIKKFGFKIALDDVGSGAYRLWEYLEEFANLGVVDVIKYDVAVHSRLLDGKVEFVTRMVSLFGGSVRYVAEGVSKKLTNADFLKLYQFGISGLQLSSRE